MQAEHDRLSSSAKWTVLVAITLALLAIILASAEIAIRVRQASS